MPRLLAGLLATLVVLSAACGPRAPRPIALGSESCAHCHMTVADPRFTAEAISNTGKVTVFDDVGCLAAWLGDNSAPIASLWVTSFVDRQTWLRADSAVYLHTGSLRTPMASGLLALRTGREADSVRTAMGGALLSWHEVLSVPHEHLPSPSR
jgi:copper chaperone NosL